MKLETTAFLTRSKEFLGRPSALLAQNFSDDAGRAAYLAGFHAAQAFFFEREGISPKTHSGVQTQFARLAKGEPTTTTSYALFWAAHTISNRSLITQRVLVRE